MKINKSFFLMTLSFCAVAQAMEIPKECNNNNDVKGNLTMGDRSNMGDFVEYDDILPALIMAYLADPKNFDETYEKTFETIAESTGALRATCRYMNNVIKKKAFGIAISIPSPTHTYRNTLLHQAVWRENLKDVQSLIKFGANADIPNNANRTPLHFAVNFLAPIALQNPEDPYAKPSIDLLKAVLKASTNCRNIQKIYKTYANDAQRKIIKSIAGECHTCSKCKFE